MYDDSVEVYVYYNTPLQWIFYLYFAGGHQLLCSLSGPLDSSYSVEPSCMGTFSGGRVELNIHWMTSLMME